MAVSYKRLWKLLVDKEMSKSDLRKKAEIAPNTMTKLRHDEEVSLTILSKICKTLHADFGFWNIRLPRILSALFIGVSLSVAGSTYQGMFRNPLVFMPEEHLHISYWLL